MATKPKAMWFVAICATFLTASNAQETGILPATSKPEQLYAFKYAFADANRGIIWIGSDTLDGCLSAEKDAMREAVGVDAGGALDLGSSSRVGTCVRLY